jgi:PLP dependent protein
LTEPPTVTTAEVVDRLGALRERIRRAGGSDLEIVAVTKALGVDAARAAIGAGLVDLGENYAQELVAKAADIDSALVRWHFIGRLQSNKVRLLAGVVGLWQSIDRSSVVRELAKRAPGADILVQVNLSGEPQKGGCGWDEVPGLVASAVEHGLQVHGLMGVGPEGQAESARPLFRRLVALADDLVLPVRSIGMSADLEVAVEEGSTMVRIGRDLLGPRPAP